MLDYETYDSVTVLLLLIVSIATWLDLRHHRIPNWLTLMTCALGLMLHFAFKGWTGFGFSFGGFFIGLLVFLPLYLAGGMGAGDVKLMAGVGAFFADSYELLLAAAMSLVAAGVYSVAVLIINKGWMPFIQRYYLIIANRSYLSAEEGSVAKRRFPFAAAILAGVVLSLGWNGHLEFYFLTNLVSFQLQAWGAGL